MKGLLFALVVIAVIAVHQAIPPPKDIGNGKEHLHIAIGNRIKSNDLEKEIKNYASQLGTVKKLKVVRHNDHFDYNFVIYNADCSKVISWMKDVVQSTKDIVGASANCEHKYITYVRKNGTKTVNLT